jgi:lysophospholipase L1-like esterase
LAKPAGLLFGLWIGLAAGAAASQDPAFDATFDDTLDCTAPADVTQFKARLPNTARAIRTGKGLRIVAIGSSSTEGIGATDHGYSYPAQFAAELRRRWPALAIAVINKGVGGEDAQQMLERFERDVLPYNPHLVIWQVGSNYTLRSTDLDAYAVIIRNGIGRLKAARTDIILMDLQYAPSILEKPLHRRMLDTMRAVANDTKVAIFRRFAVMRHWVQNRGYSMDEIVARDRLHMNDASYSCIGRLLAESVTAAARPLAPSPAEGAAAARGGFMPSGTAMR